MNVHRIEEAISTRTKAILPVHPYNQPADMDPVLELGKRYGLVVIEDAAQAHLAEYKGRRVEGMGDIGCFSFYPGNNLGTCGEAGMIVTNNPQFDRIIRMLRDWGSERRYLHDIQGYNYRMEAIQGAVLRVKLRYLSSWTEARRKHANMYNDRLCSTSVIVPMEVPYARHVYHIYAIRTRERDRVKQALHAQGIETGIHYPIPVHLQKAHADLGYQRGDFPNAEAVADEVLSLPLYAEISDDQQETVAAAISQAAAEFSLAENSANQQRHM